MKGTWQTTDSGGGGGGGGLVLAVIAAAVLIGSGAASTAAAAITSLLVTIAIIAGAVVVLAIAGVVALLVYRTRHDRPGQPITARPVYQIPPAEPKRLEAGQPLALEPPRNELHLHFHGMSAAEAAEAIRQAGQRN